MTSLHSTSFRDRWEQYDGEVWLLPLAETIRTHHFDEKSFQAFAHEVEGRTFDIPEGLRILIKELVEQLEDAGFVVTEHYFCSEVVADAFLAAGTIENVDPSDVSPKDLCRWNMYDDTYYARDEQVSVRSLPRFNTLPRGTT